jgi:hypothetical protein
MTTNLKLQWVIYVILTFFFAQLAFLMVKSHPLQGTFFNAFAGTNLKQRFDLDYWALSSKDVQEFILSNDDRPYIKVFANGQFSIEGSKLILNRGQGDRIIPTNLIMDADYAITNYRNPILNLSADPAFSTFHDLKIGSEIIATSYKRIDLESTHNVINKEMQFNNLRPYAPNYLVSGWGNSEPWGTWSSGKGAKLALNLPSNGAKHLTLNLRALVNGNHPYQKVAVSIDGQKSIDFLLSKFDSNILAIDIPTSSGPSKITVLEFDLPNAISPKDIGIDSTDSRLIAIGLVSVKFY